jgi:hypothetical protein
MLMLLVGVSIMNGYGQALKFDKKMSVIAADYSNTFDPALVKKWEEDRALYHLDPQKHSKKNVYREPTQSKWIH